MPIFRESVDLREHQARADHKASPGTEARTAPQARRVNPGRRDHKASPDPQDPPAQPESVDPPDSQATTDHPDPMVGPTQATSHQGISTQNLDKSSRFCVAKQ